MKILDFGLARLGGMASGFKTQTRAYVMGTPGYMSPEQVKGERTDHRSDIFSFGVILYELLDGHRPFQGVNAEIMAAILNNDLPELPETVPSGARQIVVHCLEKDPAKRFQVGGRSRVCPRHADGGTAAECSSLDTAAVIWRGSPRLWSLIATAFALGLHDSQDSRSRYRPVFVYAAI